MVLEGRERESAASGPRSETLSAENADKGIKAATDVHGLSGIKNEVIC